jgi:TonB family protein
MGQAWDPVPGGGIGGGVHKPGGAVTAPRVITEVKPTYTDDALLHKIQGTVVLELVVTGDGRPSQIRVVRSLDPGGLDEQAVAAAAQWRFEPGRVRGHAGGCSRHRHAGFLDSVDSHEDSTVFASTLLRQDQPYWCIFNNTKGGHPRLPTESIDRGVRLIPRPLEALDFEKHDEFFGRRRRVA